MLLQMLDVRDGIPETDYARAGCMHAIGRLHNIVACLPTAHCRIAMRELAFPWVTNDLNRHKLRSRSIGRTTVQ